MDVEPARQARTTLPQYSDSMMLPGITTPHPHKTQQPVIEHVTNLNNFRIITFN